METDCKQDLFAIDDMIEGLFRTMNSNYSYPINLGNPEEITIKNLAHKISLNLIETKLTIF